MKECRLAQGRHVAQWGRVSISVDASNVLANVSNHVAVTIQRPARITIDAGREAQQEREDQGTGLMTRQELFGNRAKDWQHETDQCFAEDAYIIERAKALGTSSGVPLEMILARFGFEPKKAAATEGPPTPEDDPVRRPP